MERIDVEKVAGALLGAAGWARLGIAEPDERLRLQAARELALSIIEEVEGVPRAPDPAQLALAL